MFTHDQLILIDWMLETATENNPNDGELALLKEKVEGLLADIADRLSKNSRSIEQRAMGDD